MVVEVVEVEKEEEMMMMMIGSALDGMAPIYP